MDEKKLTRPTSSLDAKYPGNSEVNKPTAKERERLKPIVTAKQHKPSFISKIKNSIVSNEEQSIGDFIIYDIAVPAIKALIYDTVVGGIGMMLGQFKGGQTPSNIQRNGGRSYVSYTNYYQGNNQPQTQTRNDRYAFDDIVFSSRADAENVLSELCNTIENYGLVDVAAFNELCGLKTEFTDHKWGWQSLKDAFTERVRDGYIIKLPKPKPLN